MIVLAIDTALTACQAALARDGAVVAPRSEAMERGHQERLAPMVAELFARVGVAPSVVDRVVVTVGPGSFTGLRVGIAFAKGVALGLGKPLIGVGTLQALASGAPGRVAAVIAAPHGRVYLQPLEDGLGLAPPALLEVAEAEALCRELAIRRLIGPGVESVGLAGVDRTAIAAPGIEALARLGAKAAEPATPPQPLYLREPDAKTIAERAAAKAAQEAAS